MDEEGHKNYCGISYFVLIETENIDKQFCIGS